MRLEWDKTGERLYETGVSNVAFYKRDATGKYPLGVPWNGATGLTESPSGAEPTKLYADNINYLNLMSAETFGATIEAYMYPDEFSECNGEKEIVKGIKIGQQTRLPFGLAYKTIKGNDTESNDHGYIIHIVYNCLAAPSEKAYETINESPDAITFSWELSSTPENVTGAKPTSTLTIDSTTTDKSKMDLLEAALFGGPDENAVAHLLLPDEIIALVGDPNP